MFDVVLDWLLRRIFGLSEPAVLLVIGPSRVGKTTLIRQFINELALRMMKVMKDEPSRLHKVYAEAAYLPSRGFDWEGLFVALLKDADEILIDRKVQKVWPPERANLRGLASGVNTMLLQHAPPACIIDEGGAFMESGSDDSVRRVVDYLKTLGNRSRTHFVIFGDYRLATMVQFNGALNRRCHVMHFGNYPEQYRAQFDLIVATFELRLRSLGVDADLKGSGDLLFSESCGCVGLLKRWVENAWLEKREAIGAQALIGSRFPAQSVEKWRGEIACGYDSMRRFFKGTAIGSTVTK